MANPVKQEATSAAVKTRAPSEKLLSSRWNFHANFVMNFIIFTGAVALGSMRFRGAWVALLIAVSSGYCSWGLIEYTLHRYVFHGRQSFASRGHALHHKEPQALVAVPFFTGFAVAVLLWLLLPLCLSEATTFFYIAGMTVGYTSYGILHYLMHQMTFRGARLSALQRHHEAHHRYARSNFGITSRYLDRLMGTLRET